MDSRSEENKELSIKAINKDAVHQICSGQVVLNLATAVKELVENSLDAGATVIEVRLREYGSELLEVVDNGIGVQEENFEGLTLKHHTSKLREFSDLVSVETFGFRGEALSSLCALSDMTITTRHSIASCGTKMEFDHHGKIIAKKPCARQVGTTVTLQNIFSTLPVRHKEFHRNLRREFTRMTQLLYAYCLVSTGTKITCVNQNKKGGRTVVVSTQGSETIRENIACVFGSKQLQSLMDFEQKPPNETVLQEYGMPVEMALSEVPFHLEGCISSCAHGQGRSAADRQFFYVNSRPCEPAKIVKIVNEVYHQFNQHQYPFVFLNLKMARTNVDVNVTPDKRQVFLDQEKLLVAIIKASLLQMYETIPSTFNFQNLPPTPVTPVPSSPQATPAASLAERFKQWKHSKTPPTSSPGKGIKRITEFTNRQENKKSKLHSIDRFFSPVRKKENSFSSEKASLHHDSSLESRSFANNSFDNEKETQSSDTSDIEIINDDTVLSSLPSNVSELKNNFTDEANMDGEDGSSVNNKLINNEEASENKRDFDVSEDSSQGVSSKALPTNEVNSLSRRNAEVNQKLCTENIDENAKACSTESEKIDSISVKNDSHDDPLICDTDIRDENNHNLTTANIEENSDSNYETTDISELSPKNETYDDIKLIVIKTDDRLEDVRRKFVQMTVSFDDIKRKIENRKKRNAERNETQTMVKFRTEIDPSKNKCAEQELQKEISKDMFAKMEILGQFNLGFIVTRLGLDLFIIDQHATDEKYNFEMLQRNTVIQNQRLVLPQKLELTAVNESILMESEEVFRKNGFDFIIDEKAEPTKRIQLTAVPISKNWHFGKEDIDELLFMLQDSPNTMCRPSRVRAMFASRACRKSVMIGTALNKSDMRRLVNQMGEIEQPWNCPHGRPTMRHLVNLGLLNTS